MGKTLIRILKIAVSVGLLVFLVSRAGLSEIFQVARSADVGVLSWALIVYTSTVIVVSWRWQLLLTSQNAKVPFGQVVSLYFIGFFFNNFLPTSIGGDIYRVWGAGKDSGKRAISAASVVVERLLGLLAVSALAILAMLVVRQVADASIRAFVLIIFGGSMVLLLALFFSRGISKFLKALTRKFSLWGLGQRLMRFYEAVTLYRRKKRILISAFVISIVYQLFIVLFSYLVARGLGLGIAWHYFILFVPVTVIMSWLPISINGVGVRETGYVLLLSKIGHSSSEALTLSLLIYGLSVLASLVGGVLYLLRGAKPPRQPAPVG